MLNIYKKYMFVMLDVVIGSNIYKKIYVVINRIILLEVWYLFLSLNLWSIHLYLNTGVWLYVKVSMLISVLVYILRLNKKRCMMIDSFILVNYVWCIQMVYILPSILVLGYTLVDVCLIKLGEQTLYHFNYGGKEVVEVTSKAIDIGKKEVSNRALMRSSDNKTDYVGCFNSEKKKLSTIEAPGFLARDVAQKGIEIPIKTIKDADMPYKAKYLVYNSKVLHDKISEINYFGYKNYEKYGTYVEGEKLTYIEYIKHNNIFADYNELKLKVEKYKVLNLQKCMKCEHVFGIYGGEIIDINQALDDQSKLFAKDIQNLIVENKGIYYLEAKSESKIVRDLKGFYKLCEIENRELYKDLDFVNKNINKTVREFIKKGLWHPSVICKVELNKVEYYMLLSITKDDVKMNYIGGKSYVVNPVMVYKEELDTYIKGLKDDIVYKDFEDYLMHMEKNSVRGTGGLKGYDTYEVIGKVGDVELKNFYSYVLKKIDYSNDDD